MEKSREVCIILTGRASFNGKGRVTKGPSTRANLTADFPAQICLRKLVGRSHFAGKYAQPQFIL